MCLFSFDIVIFPLLLTNDNNELNRLSLFRTNGNVTLFLDGDDCDLIVAGSVIFLKSYIKYYYAEF